jgi:endonuclease/exonuclease/phosphatase (EEP) superfamily protein YafD
VRQLDAPVLLVGDLNATPWSHGMRLLRDGTDLGYRSPDPAWTATWYSFYLLGIPIDHALATPPLVIARREIGPSVGSDHRPQLLEIGWQS